MADPFLTHEDNILLCPLCGGNNVHIDDAYVAGRPREDGPVVPVHVNAGGKVDTNRPGASPTTPGRRHSIAVAGWCELCGASFAIEFRQNRGQTELSILQTEWKPFDPDEAPAALPQH